MNKETHQPDGSPCDKLMMEQKWFEFRHTMKKLNIEVDEDHANTFMAGFQAAAFSPPESVDYTSAADYVAQLTGNTSHKSCLEHAERIHGLVEGVLPKREIRKVTGDNLKAFLDDVGFSNWCCGCDNKSYNIKKSFSVSEIEDGETT